MTATDTQLIPPRATRQIAAPLGGAAIVGICLLVVFVLIAVFAPLFVGDFGAIDTTQRLRPPGPLHPFGTDHLGRDIFLRTLAGTRTSMIVGVTVGFIVTLVGVGLGLCAGYFRFGGQVIMRVMDGLMAIPGILLAIALAAILGTGFGAVIIAITVPEVPRMARLIRSVVVSLREQLFVTAATAIGASVPRILLTHILPNTLGALLVQATYVCAASIIAESVLSFLGVGIPPDVPSWGNIMSVGRQYFLLAPWIIAAPGIFLVVLVLAINLVGDALRDRLDPRLVPTTRM